MKYLYKLFVFVLLFTFPFVTAQELQKRPSSSKYYNSPVSPSLGLKKNVILKNSIYPKIQRELPPISKGSGLLVVANNNLGIHIIDPSTNTVYGPFFKTEMSQNNLDCVITPDGKTAIVSSFDNNNLYFIDISNPASPTLLDSTTIDFPAEDLDITPDGKFVLVTDGGETNEIASINISTRKVVQSLSFDGEGQAVAIAKDGRTVLVAGYDLEKIYVFTLNPLTGTLSYINQISLDTNPLNITISPDGKTVIVVSDRGPSDILRINSPGNVNFVRDLSNSGNYKIQSCVFSNDGEKAYALTISDTNSHSVLIYNISMDGTVTFSEKINLIYSTYSNSFYGVDQMALDNSNKLLYINNYSEAGGVEVIDLTTMDNYYLAGAGPYTTGIGSWISNIYVTNPAGGEDWQTGTAHNITWTSGSISNVNIELSTDNGATWSAIATNVSASTGSYNWMITSAPYSTQCRIRISDASNEAINDVSNQFTIKPETFTGTSKAIMLLQPNGGETLQGGTTYYIVFRKLAFFPSVKLEYTTDDGATWNQILSYPLSGLTFYPWSVPLVNSDKCRIRVSNWNDQLMNEESLYDFTITTSVSASNYPNPFNPSTTIRFNMLKAGHASIRIFNSLGQQVSVLLNRDMQRGVHDVRFNADSYPSGVYFYEVNANGTREVKKMLYLK